MATALVVAERGSGLTTFVGLLYTAQVRLGIEASDGFRFHADRASLRAVEGVYGALGAGEFPARELDWDGRPLSFVFGFRHRALPGLPGGSDDAEFDTVEVRVGGLPVDEGADLAAYEARLPTETLHLLESSVVMVLVDASWLPSPPAAALPVGLDAYDRRLASTLELLRKFHASERERRRRTIYPFVILTKADRLTLGALRRFDAPGGPPTRWSPAQRAAFGGRVLRGCLPKTAQLLESKRADGVTVRAPHWFFSGLETEARNGVVRVCRRERGPSGGWEPEYPYEEFRGLLKELGRIAHQVPTAVEAV